jgi:CxxC motif-containing protein (DUF1111 family)
VWGRAAQVVRGLRKKREPVCCMGCHTPMMVTPAQSETEALQNLTVHPFSDLLIHHMGKGLADDITQGKATGDMFRTTPLWGLGQRIFFLHDRRLKRTCPEKELVTAETSGNTARIATARRKQIP